jgi:hypothetical protein
MEGSRSVQIITDPDPGGPKTYRYGSGSGTLRKTVIYHCPGGTLPALFLSTGEADTMVFRDWVEHTRDRLGEQKHRDLTFRDESVRDVISSERHCKGGTVLEGQCEEFFLQVFL